VGMLLAFAPFIIFALVDRFAGPTEGLVAGALVSAALVARSWLSSASTPKILDVGTTLLFGGLALYGALWRPAWSVIGVRVCVDIGLLLIIIASMLVGRPFTLQYAHERVAPELWGKADFIRLNYVITATWALAFAVMVMAELALLYVPGLPQPLGIAAIVAAFAGAAAFTSWYRKRVRVRTA